MQEGKVATYSSRQLKTLEVNYPTHDLEGKFGGIISMAQGSRSLAITNSEVLVR